MQLSEFLANPKNPHSVEGNRWVKCNALYKKDVTFNCYLTPSQAIEFAGHLLAKAQLILDNGIDDAGVLVWSRSPKDEKIYFGLKELRKGGRRKPKLK